MADHLWSSVVLNGAEANGAVDAARALYGERGKIHPNYQHRAYGGRAAWADVLSDLDFSATAWMSDGNCVGTDVESFFPDEFSRASATVKRMCATCPVVDDCREWALEKDELGFWGGTSQAERKRINSDRRLG